MKLISSTEYVDALNREIESLRKQLKDNGIKPVSPPDYVAISKRERAKVKEEK